MSFEYASARPAAPRPSSFLASLTDSPRPPAPSGVPNVVHDTYDLFLNPVVPITFGLVYFVVAKTLSHYQDGKNRIRGKGWDTVVLLHNIILAVYSAWTFLGTAPHVFGEFWRGFADNGVAGLTHAFCDSDSSVWSSTFSKYSYLFYLSKYWCVPFFSAPRAGYRSLTPTRARQQGGPRHGDPAPQGQEGRHAPELPPHGGDLDHVRRLRHPGHAGVSPHFPRVEFPVY